MKTVLIISMLFFAVPVFAVTYEWVDERGTVNFTEDLGNVPKKYRKKVKVLGADEGNGPKVTEIEEGGKATPKGTEGKADAKDEPSVKDGKKKPAIYGGKNETAWKNEYRKLSADVNASEEQLEQLNSRLSDPSKLSRAEYLSVQHTIKNTEMRRNDQRKKLDIFKESAEKAGVPTEVME